MSAPTCPVPSTDAEELADALGREHRAHTLSNEQRSEAFSKALAIEDGLKELESLKARLLAGLEAQAEAMRQNHTRLMRAATTGVNPEAPEQQPLPLEAPTAFARAPVAEASPNENKPPPEPPKGKGRNRSRKPKSEATGKKRAEVPVSARTATAPQASVSSGLDVDDAVPAPRIPCCECGHSVADHEGGTGRCSGRAKGRACRCKSFTAVAVELLGAPGWKVRPFKGQLSTGKGGEQGCILVGGEDETLPLFWVPGYGLAFQNGGTVSAVYSHLGEGATTLTYVQDERWYWVPKQVLRAVAEYLGATWPEPSEASAAPEALPRMETTADHPCECDGCGETFKSSELQSVGNGFYCPTCKAELEEQDGEGEAPAALAEGDVPERDDPFVVPATDGVVDSSFGALDLSSMERLLGKPRRGYSTYSVKVHGNSPRACEACGTRDRPRAWISVDRDDRESKRGAIVGGSCFGLALCAEHSSEEGGRLALDNRRRWYLQGHAHRAEAASASPDAPSEATSSPVAAPVPPVDLFGFEWPPVDEARFPGWFVQVIRGWCGPADSIETGRLHQLFLAFDVKGPEGQDIQNLRWFGAAEGGPRILVGEHTRPNVALDVVFPEGLYAALVEHLSGHWPMSEEIREAARKAKEATPPASKTPRKSKKRAATADHIEMQQGKVS
ncbi:hypothetical protein ACN28E_24855 [Archangium lansingense]|uniref:hypothetical protein n=1 Tax=Archangium lansingense TaxID=2995310 RepID=UPI003B7C49AE